ncbi:hypothetical protein [Roseomonas indoligenes]|uniref:Uncharacterized protein n=1 Tax=Roseomonas indoligenes TaxID=2820811 RepID=A0A940N053_9PROT|nr:hypothetical protein [Pararoseomonas indoligenes]MBP0492845.1 hypothetical protein [Pararoseomonas indoligenes]
MSDRIGEYAPTPVTVPSAPAWPEAAVQGLLDEIGLSALTPTHTHEQRVELVKHIGARCQAVLSTLPQATEATTNG